MGWDGRAVSSEVYMCIGCERVESREYESECMRLVGRC